VSCSSRFSISASSTPARERPSGTIDLHAGAATVGGVAAPLSSPRRRLRPRAPQPAAAERTRDYPALRRANRGSAVAVVRRAWSGVVTTAVPGPDLRLVNDLVAVGLQPDSHVLRRPGGGGRAVDADGEDVIGHGVGQHGSGVHGSGVHAIQGAVSAAPRPPGLRP
jgi:hypothetical protein